MTRFRPLIELSVLAAAAFAIHFSLLNFVWPERHELFRYPIWLLYAVFFAASVVILLGLNRMKSRNIDSIGHAFLWLTSIKTVLAYFLLHPILSDSHQYLDFEKAHFFAVFAMFLTIETIVSVRVLNKL